MNILIIDDDQGFAAMLKEALETRGHAVAYRPDPVSGNMALAASKPDLLFLDVDMPAGGGAAVYSSLRGKPETGNLPVIVVTGTTPQDLAWQKLKAMPHPLTYLMSKPVNLPTLLGWVDSIARRGR
jgi:CheY-like chemotaxis protein